MGEALGHEEDQAGAVEGLLHSPGLADALESDRFKQFLDHVPVAIAVAELGADETIVYVNVEFERLTGRAAAELEGSPWAALPGCKLDDPTERLGDAADESQDYLGAYVIERPDGASQVDVWSNIIVDDGEQPLFRLIALAGAGQPAAADVGEVAKRLRDKDVELRELQHRVRNNLQMITALVRLEARNAGESEMGLAFDRLAGRVQSLSLLYHLLAEQKTTSEIDLGVYLSEIASAVMHAHASEGVHLNLAVDAWPVSVNVAMPTGLVVNELMTNSLKHAFVGRDGGTVSLAAEVHGEGCTVTYADDGVGLPQGVTWPRAGKLGAMIVRALRQNAGAEIEVGSDSGRGLRVRIRFARAAASPAAGA